MAFDPGPLGPSLGRHSRASQRRPERVRARAGIMRVNEDHRPGWHAASQSIYPGSRRRRAAVRHALVASCDTLDGALHTYTTADRLQATMLRVDLDSMAAPMAASWMGSLRRAAVTLRERSFRELDRTRRPPQQQHPGARFSIATGVLWIGTYDGGLGRFREWPAHYDQREGRLVQQRRVPRFWKTKRGGFWMTLEIAASTAWPKQQLERIRGGQAVGGELLVLRHRATGC